MEDKLGKQLGNSFYSFHFHSKNVHKKTESFSFTAIKTADALNDWMSGNNEFVSGVS